MEAFDFSNVFNRHLKEFRNVYMGYENDEDEEEDEDYGEECKEYIKKFEELGADYIEKQKQKAEKTSEPKKSATQYIDGALYNLDMTKLISAPKDVDSFTIPESVTLICDRAFNYCHELSSVIIPDTVKGIGKYVFDHCEKLSSIYIPRSVGDVNGYVFIDCPNLVKIVISDCESRIKYDASLRCKYIDITSYDVKTVCSSERFISSAIENKCKDAVYEEDTKQLISDDGVVFNKDMTKLISYPIGNTETYSIPQSVKTIGDHAFCGHSTLTSVEIPNSVEYIEKYAFAGCSGLKSVRLPESLIAVKEHAFYNCVSLENVEIGVIGINIDDTAFEGCTKNPLGSTFDVEWKDIVIQDGWLDILENKRTATLPIKCFLGYQGKNKVIAKIRCEGARTFMNAVMRRMNFSFHRLVIRFQFGSEPYVVNENVLEEGLAILENNRVIETEEIEWRNVHIENNAICISNKSGKKHLKISHNAAKKYMDSILKRVRKNLPKLTARIEEGADMVIENQLLLDDVIATLLDNKIVKTEEIDWNEVKFLDYGIQIKDISGALVSIRYDKAMGFMNKMLKRMTDYLPRLIVHFEEGKEPIIENLGVLDDITTILTKRQDYGALIRANIKTSDVLKALNVISKKDTRVFVPRDMTPYLDFLSEHQAIDTYPIVPVEEYIGGSYEEGALFTIILNGKPYIVWENFKDSRSTYVFKCTESNYEEKRQRIYDYIVTEESNKRQFLRNKDCKQIFGEKPCMIVHNNLKSWAEKLMNVEDLGENEDESSCNAEIQDELPEIIMSQELPDNDYDDLYDDDDYDVLLLTQNEFNLIRNIKVYISFLVDFELYFADDELWDEEGTSRNLYENGRKAMYAETAFTIKDAEFCEDDFTVYAGSKGSFFAVDNRDIYNPVDLPKIEIVSRSRFNGVDGIVERICDIIESYDFDFAPYGSEVRVKIYNKGKKYTYDFSV